MTAATSKQIQTAGPQVSPAPLLSIDDLVLLRIAASPATRAELQRDLAALFAPKINGTAFRRSAELAITNHADQQLIVEHKGRLTAQEAGVRSASLLLAPGRITDTNWEHVKAALLPRAIGLKAVSPNVAKALTRLDGLSALVVQRHFGLATEKVLSPTTLRAELAVVALEKAFGNKIKTGLGKGSGLPGKAGRVLAGQLFKSPRELATDGKLILALAAEIASAAEQTLEALTIALLRRLTTLPRTEPVAKIATKTAERRPAPQRAPDNDAAPLSDDAREPRLLVRPDMAEFSAAVVSAARPVSEGWPGNRKAFISLVWKAIRNQRPEWELTEVAFKSMLAEAHRSGHVVLSGADLKDKCDLRTLEDSKILYKNTVWHFVRVED